MSRRSEEECLTRQRISTGIEIIKRNQIENLELKRYNSYNENPLDRLNSRFGQAKTESENTLQLKLSNQRNREEKNENMNESEGQVGCYQEYPLWEFLEGRQKSTHTKHNEIQVESTQRDFTSKPTKSKFQK